MNNLPKLSVVTITYGHEDFIIKTLEGVLMQEYSGEIEFIIANDNSPDRTDDRIRDFLEKTNYPINFIVKYTSNKINKGMMPNFIWALKKATGKYVALCEGDDYWTDPLKLQKQVDFLEANEDFSICFHKATCIYEENIIPFHKDINVNTPDVSYLDDIVGYNYIHTPTAMFRNHNDTPVWLIKAYPGDWPLHIINATYGKIKFLPESMAVYRIHSGGAHSTTGGRPLESLATLVMISDELKRRGFKRQAKIVDRYYHTAMSSHYVFNENNTELSRWEKTKMLINSKNKNFRKLFLIPLLFNNRSFKVFDQLSKWRNNKNA